ncbi:hypothetical protein P885DRAFT_71219 [Corynascus similis CBS 632.67]
MAIEPVRTVAIVGASGRIGGAFAEALLQTGKHTVTAVIRKGSNGTVPEGVNKVVVDYDDESSVVEALKGQQFLIITLSFNAPPDLHPKIVAAAGKAQVPYVMPNYYSYPLHSVTEDSDFYTKLSFERLQDVPRNGFSAQVTMACGFWYEWSLALGEEWFGFDIARRKVTIIDDGKRTITATTWNQCGRAVAALLSLPQKSSGSSSPSLADFIGDKGLLIESFHVSQRDMLDSLHRVLGTTDSDWDIAHESSDKRRKDGTEALQRNDVRGFAKLLFANIFDVSNPVSNYVGEANLTLSLPKEDLDEATRRAIDMVNNEYRSSVNLDLP